MAYFIAVNGQTTGPFNEAQLRVKAAAREFVPNSQVWTQGMTQWVEAHTIAELEPILKEVRPEPKFDAPGFLSGTWQSGPTQVDVPGVGPGTRSGRVTYKRDGTYILYQELRVMMIGSMTTQTTTGQGTYEAVEQGPGVILVTFKGQATMNITGGGSAMPPQTEQVSGSFVLKIVDNNTVSDPDGSRASRVSN